jgi:capsular polysaccharide biosynthesis protein
MPTEGAAGPGRAKRAKQTAKPHSRRAVIPGLHALRSVLPGGEGRVVVLLADESMRNRVSEWIRELDGDDVLVLTPEPAPEWEEAELPFRIERAGSIGQITTQLGKIGAIDLLVNLLPSARLPVECEDHTELFVKVFRHLRRGGAFVHDRTAAPGEVDPSLSAWLTFVDTAEDRGRRAELGRAATETARSVGTIAVTRDLIVVTKRHQHFRLMRDVHSTGLITSREPELQIEEIDRRAAGEFDSRTKVVHHGAAPEHGGMPDVIRHPPLVTRHYRGRVAMSGNTLMWTGHTVLPDSLRWHLTERPFNPLLSNVVGDFARLDRGRVPRRALDGDFYQLESAYRSHFGHLLTEVVSRLWGWDEAKRRNPGLKALFHPKKKRGAALERQLFTAFGIAEEDLVPVDDPVWVESVASASPMWHNAEPHFVHPDLTDTWARLTTGLLSRASDVATSPRIFVSRDDDLSHRACRNVREVEAAFAAQGFTVVHPERHPLPDQARLFHEARVVAGFGGSGMFNVMHTDRLDALIVLNHTAYFPRNEHLFAALKGGESHYFWSPADVEPSEHGNRMAAMQSSWEFDFATLGGELEALLRGL